MIGASENAYGAMAYHKACVIRNCFVDCRYSGTSDTYISSQRIAIASISVTGTGPFTATLTSVTAHHLTTGRNILITGVPEADFNGNHEVTYVSATVLQFSMPGASGPATCANAFLGAQFNGIEAGGGIGTIIESNRIFNCTCGFYQNELAVKDLVIRDNYFRGINSGIYLNLGGVSQQGGIAATSITRAGAVATLTAPNPHGLSSGQAVKIAATSPSTPFSGTFPVTVIDPTVFTYGVAASGSNPASATFGALWQVGRIIIENNVIDLILTVVHDPVHPTADNGYQAPVGILLFDSEGSHGTEFVFNQVVIRENVIQCETTIVGGTADPSKLQLGIYLDSCRNAIVEGNNVNLTADYPIRHYVVSTIKYFDNQTPAGKLIQGAHSIKSGSSRYMYKTDDFKGWTNELTTDADLGLTLSI
jgi:hypothetical protein